MSRFWVVVSNIFYFSPYLGRWSNLTVAYFSNGLVSTINQTWMSKISIGFTKALPPFSVPMPSVLSGGPGWTWRNPQVFKPTPVDSHASVGKYCFFFSRWFQWQQWRSQVLPIPCVPWGYFGVFWIEIYWGHLLWCRLKTQQQRFEMAGNSQVVVTYMLVLKGLIDALPTRCLYGMHLKTNKKTASLLQRVFAVRAWSLKSFCSKILRPWETQCATGMECTGLGFGEDDEIFLPLRMCTSPENER